MKSVEAGAESGASGQNKGEFRESSQILVSGEGLEKPVVRVNVKLLQFSSVSNVKRDGAGLERD